MIKSISADGKARVEFALDRQVEAQSASVCGDWNRWSGDADVMSRDVTGGFSLTIELETGRAYRFRYLLDGERWENDWDADAYVPNDYGEDDSLVDLTGLASDRGVVADRAPRTRKASSEKATPAKRAPAANKAKPAAGSDRVRTGKPAAKKRKPE